MPWPDDFINKVICGDAIETMKGIPDGVIQCCITSPPFWGLRDYGVDGQYGLESTPEEYVAKMVEVFREVRRVLRDDGTMWLNLGDCYAGGGCHNNPNIYKAALGHKPIRPAVVNLKPKDLAMIPARVALALQADDWWLRSVIIWSKPSCMPESVTDRPTTSHEYVYLLAKSADYYCDMDAIREDSIDPESLTGRRQRYTSKCDEQPNYKMAGYKDCTGKVYLKRNKRTVWTINPEPTPYAHFATFPQKLVEPPILAGSKPGDIVLDPFSGSGTVGVVAKKLLRNYVLIDLNAEYNEKIAKPRLAQREMQLK